MVIQAATSNNIPAVSAPKFGIVLVLFFASGFAGLVYEVLWMKQLGLLFGNTSYAAATTLAAFFLGIASGAYVLGRRAEKSPNPLKTYGLLEAGVTITALLYFFLLDAYYSLYQPLFNAFGPGHPLFLGAKFLLAVGVLFPPAFFMGGTLPMLSQYLVRSKANLGRTASILYGVNTFGAATGALVAGFYLPRVLGFTNAYWVAISTTAIVGVLAWYLGRSEPDITAQSDVSTDGESISDQTVVDSLPIHMIRTLAFLSGFLTLGLEVLWTRMFAQVLQNSVYTFSTILVTFLVSLALGAELAYLLIRRRVNVRLAMFGLLSASALLVAISPNVFMWMTGDLGYLGTDRGWANYMILIFGNASAVMLLPGVLMGCVFPYLFRLSESVSGSAGQTVGNLAAINTGGAVLGSLCAGFLLLDSIGLWSSIHVIAAIYLLAALYVVTVMQNRQLATGVLGSVGVIVLLLGLGSSELPLVTVDAVGKKEQVLEVWEGSAANVAIVDGPDTRRIKVNNYYGLGGTRDHKHEERQSHLPLIIHQNPRRVFYLGMGTGITAGAALQHPVEEVVVTEIVPEVVLATKKYFQDYLHGLHDDPRVSVIADDGRNYLLGSRQKFDVIVADLFVPWQAGIGSLYSLEHYQAAKARLEEGGLYAQWLPLFQLTEAEFGSIARTMLEVFPRVTVWRSKFQGLKPIMLLAGHTDMRPLDLAVLRKNLARVNRDQLADRSNHKIGRSAVPANLDVMLLHYGGNLSSAASIVASYPLNTDDRPVIEYQAPVSHRSKKAGKVPWLIGSELIQFYKILSTVTPPEEDPFLEQLSRRQKQLVHAGLELHHTRAMQLEGDKAGARKAFGRFQAIYGR